MSETQLHQDSDSSRGYLPILLLLFVGSGCAALIYEIVWFQLLRLAIGSTAVSLGVLLGTFMGGMCLGSVALPLLDLSAGPSATGLRAAGTGNRRDRAWLLFCCRSPASGTPQSVGPGLGGITLRGVMCAICLLPPTVLMGATLPAIARWMETSPVGVSRLGFFYGANIAGAVAGCLLAGFYLLRVHDVAVATYVAATINAVDRLCRARLCPC